MAAIIGNIAATVCVVSMFITLYYGKRTNKSKRELYWIGVMFVSLVIAYVTIPFR